MERYKNEDYLKQEIMNQSRHLFIYGYNSVQRKQFLKSMSQEYPIILDQTSPMAIYLDEYGLPKIQPSNGELNKNKIDLISSEFLYFSIIENILLKLKENNDLDILNERIKKLIETLNIYSMNRDFSQITDLDDLIRILTQSKEFYKKCYIEYYGNGQETLSINDIPLPFIQFDIFVKQLKEALKNDSYFAIIIDKQRDISITSIYSINSLIGGRINKDVSMKIVTEPDKWDSYRDSNGQLIECVHDYGTIELDDSLSKHLQRIRRKI